MTIFKKKVNLESICFDIFKLFDEVERIKFVEVGDKEHKLTQEDAERLAEQFEMFQVVSFGLQLFIEGMARKCSAEEFAKKYTIVYAVYLKQNIPDKGRAMAKYEKFSKYFQDFVSEFEKRSETNKLGTEYLLCTIFSEIYDPNFLIEEGLSDSSQFAMKLAEVHLRGNIVGAVLKEFKVELGNQL